MNKAVLGRVESEPNQTGSRARRQGSAVGGAVRLLPEESGQRGDPLIAGNQEVPLHSSSSSPPLCLSLLAPRRVPDFTDLAVETSSSHLIPYPATSSPPLVTFTPLCNRVDHSDSATMKILYMGVCSTQLLPLLAFIHLPTNTLSRFSGTILSPLSSFVPKRTSPRKCRLNHSIHAVIGQAQDQALTINQQLLSLHPSKVRFLQSSFQPPSQRASTSTE